MPIFSEGRVLPDPSRGDRGIAIASKGHCTGFSVLGAGAGTRVAAESWTEQRHLHLQAARRDVAQVREQVRFRYGRRDEHEHFFDMLVVKTDGQRIAYTVKPQARLASGRFVEEMQTIAWWVRERGFAASVRLLTEADIDRIALHNANIDMALRDDDPEALTAAREAVRTLRGGVPIRELTQKVGLGARGYRALLNLVSAGELSPLHNEKITPETRVQPKEYTA